MRKIEIKDPAIKKSLKKKGRIYDEMLKLGEANDELKKQADKNFERYNTLTAQSQREDERIRPVIAREFEPYKKDLKEFEEMTGVYTEDKGKDKGKTFFKISNLLEEFKVNYVERKAKKDNEEDNGSNTTQDGGGNNVDKTKPSEVVEVSGDTGQL